MWGYLPYLWLPSRAETNDFDVLDFNSEVYVSIWARFRPMIIVRRSLVSDKTSSVANVGTDQFPNNFENLKRFYTNEKQSSSVHWKDKL